MRGTRADRVRAGLVSTAVTGLLLSGCSSEFDSAAPETEEPAASASTSAAPTTWPYLGTPLAGGDATQPVLVVKIDNTSRAAPQEGLGQADLVVEELVEGGSTRLAAFFQSAYPDEVGPVRSMRATDIGIVPSDGSTTIVTSGAAQRTIARIDEAGIPFVEEGAPGFSRAADRAVPYNLVADLTEIEPTAAGGDRPADYLAWGESDAYAAGTPATEIDVRFSPDHTTSWELDGEQYVVDDAFSADGDGFSADTVLALEVDVVDAGYLDPAGNPVPESVLEGSGTATVVHGGRAVAATWTKASPSASLALTTSDGAVLTVPPGRTWIELVPSGTGSVDVG
ncbi:DUF3048 domain-containing protein [Nocardioides zeae]|uniref:DUF3048 domain-containing protein n=1 Tax=Nocardioides zeae TaxID=1457234 RepID=A0AAJ1TZJ0_9ACTN|nr:DUF3048 domain-containing protein [Nocardioides zeae]MDQ1102900.1 hypothetical protein [Nocardioides zeae]